MFSQQKPFREIYKLSKIDLLQQIKRKLAIKMIICSVLEVYETTLIPMCVARKFDQFQRVELLSDKYFSTIQMQLRFQYEFMARIHIISNHFINQICTSERT